MGPTRLLSALRFSGSPAQCPRKVTVAAIAVLVAMTLLFSAAAHAQLPTVAIGGRVAPAKQ